MKKFKCFIYGLILFNAAILSNVSSAVAQTNAVFPDSISFMHYNDRLQGWFYKAKGDGPFPTIILLQGSVGRDGDIFNLGKSLSEEGFNVMTYNYPGSWRSEGLRTDRAALESIKSALEFVRSEPNMQNLKIDTGKIILAGHSYGGGMALLAAALDPGIHHVISIAGADLYETANELEQNPEKRQNFQQMVDRLLMNPSMIRGPVGQEYVETMLSDKDSYNTVYYAETLAQKHLLLLTGWLDRFKPMERYTLPLYRALQSSGAQNVKIVAFETGHEFLNVQNEVTKTIIDWLKQEYQK